jgi:Arc/MetJ-type ribon-helix-helix transcriptional regulator
MERINIKIDEEEKKEIDCYVQDNKEYSSMSHFLRVAAKEEMDDEDERLQQVPPRITRTLDEIVNKLDEVQEGISGLASRLDSDSRDIEELAHDVYEAIPVAPVANSAEITAAAQTAQQLDRQHADTVLQHTDAPSTVPELARHLDADKEDIKEALRQLKSNFLPILELVDEEGNKHFLKQEERR